jgi:putative merR family transcriptional regulator
MRRLVFLIRMRVSGMTMTELRRYIDLVEQGPGTKPERLKVMQEHRARVRSKIAELQFALDITDYKIATYGGNLGDEPTLHESTHKETP